VSDYSLVKRGVISLTDADVGTSKDVALSGEVKTGSTFLTATVRAVRKTVKIQHGQIAATETDTSPQNAAITAVADLARAYVVATTRESRAGGSGVSVKLSDVDEVRAEWLGGALGGGEDIVVEFSVIEHLLTRPPATIRLLDEDTVRVEWDAQLEEGESIVVAYEAFDVEGLGDDLKEILFRLQKILGIQGENSIQDLQLYDGAGNPTSFRVRVFDSESSVDDATVNLPEGDALESGELSRYKVTLDWAANRNRPTSIVSVRTHLLTPTPGVN
jgi:hypothetical protein